MEKGSITYKSVLVKQLKLDTKNPRIAQWIEMYGEDVTDEHMKLALQRGGSDDKVTGPSYRSLKESMECTPMIGQVGLGESGGVLYYSAE